MKSTERIRRLEEELVVSKSIHEFCRDKFREYQIHHEAKGTSESLKKADVNREASERCALAVLDISKVLSLHPTAPH